MVVVDIGLDADGAIEHLRRQLAIVEIIDKLDGQLSPDPYRLAEPGSELAALAETAPDAPVNLVLSVRAGLTAGEQLATSGFDDSAAPDVLAEHIMWVWHAYSGAAHGYAWPWLLPGTASLAGDFIADLGLVVPVTHLAFDVAQRRCRINCAT